jgi:hypothetical protein
MTSRKSTCTAPPVDPKPKRRPKRVGDCKDMIQKSKFKVESVVKHRSFLFLVSDEYEISLPCGRMHNWMNENMPSCMAWLDLICDFMTPLHMNSILGSTRVVKTKRGREIPKQEINRLKSRERHAHLQRPFPARKCRQSPEHLSRSLRPPVLSSAPQRYGGDYTEYLAPLTTQGCSKDNKIWARRTALSFIVTYPVVRVFLGWQRVKTEEQDYPI